MLEQIKSYSKYTKELMQLSLPIIIGNLGFMLISISSVFIAAKYSTQTLAEISIAHSFISCIFIFSNGVMASISPILANYRGGRQQAKKYFFPTILFSLCLSLLSILIILLIIPVTEKIGLPVSLLPMIKKYLFISAFSTIGGYLYTALKEYLQAFEIVFAPNLFGVLGIFLNIILSFIFVFGFGQVPSLGAAGIAYANLAVRSFQGFALLIFSLKVFNFKIFYELDYFINIIKIGFPLAIDLLFETFIFSIIMILLGTISSVYAASQSILLTLVNSVFMIPLSISSAISIKAGYANGAKKINDFKKYSISGMFISLIFTVICLIIYIIYPSTLIKIFTNDTEIIKIATPIVLLLGIFQILDGLQISLSGVYKSLKKTKIVMLNTLVAYGLIALPFGYIFTFKYNQNLSGFWIGLTIAMFLLNISLLLKLNKIFKTMN